mgnify:CR=1 FL=1
MKWFARIPERISMEQALGWKLGWEKWFYTQDLELPAGWSYQEHSMAASFQQMMRGFFGDPSQEFVPPRLKLMAAEQNQWAQRLLEKVPAAGKKIALCIQTTSQTKDWPVEKFSRVCDWLAETYGATLYLTGIPAHRERGTAILQIMQHREAVVDLIGRTSFLELTAFCPYGLTVDSGYRDCSYWSGCRLSGGHSLYL